MRTLDIRTKQKKIDDFNADGVGLTNTNIFGLPFNYRQSEIVIIPVPWDVTVSYLAGTAYGPQAVFDYSSQIDLFDFDFKDAWKAGFFMSEISSELLEKNNILRHKAKQYISFLEEGGIVEDNTTMSLYQKQINEECTNLLNWVKQQVQKALNTNKIPIVLGGEHSVPLGLMRAIDNKYKDWGILQIDAHADLRIAYEGFEYSHASIMYNALNTCNNLSKLVSVGVRDFCDMEYELAEKDDRIIPFYWQDISNKRLENSNFSWKQQCEEIIENLPQNVYISFDIDGLQPQLCPNTGTPVPGGFAFEEASFLLKTLVNSGRKIIGADLCEVSVGETYPAEDTTKEFNANVGSRILYKLCGAMVYSNNLFGKNLEVC